FLEAVGYNTLCIDVFSKNLAAGGGWGQDMKSFLEHLENKGLWLGEQSFSIATEYSAQQRKPHKNSDEIMRALYDIAELEQQEKDLLVSFALLPAENHPPEVLTTLLTDSDKTTLKNGLDGLRRKGWLSGDGRSYRISPVIQKVVRSKHEEQIWDYGAPIIARLIAFFKYEGYHSVNIKIAAPFSALVFGIIDLLKVENEDIIELFDKLWVYFNATGNLSKAIETGEKMAEVAKKINHKNNLAIAYSKLGETYSTLGDLPQALEFFEKDAQLTKDLYDAKPQNVAFKNGLAISYEKLGETYGALG